jgi:hypothetical protein
MIENNGYKCLHGLDAERVFIGGVEEDFMACSGVGGDKHCKPCPYNVALIEADLERRPGCPLTLAVLVAGGVAAVEYLL